MVFNILLYKFKIMEAIVAIKLYKPSILSILGLFLIILLNILISYLNTKSLFKKLNSILVK